MRFVSPSFLPRSCVGSLVKASLLLDSHSQDMTRTSEIGKESAIVLDSQEDITTADIYIMYIQKLIVLYIIMYNM